MGEVRERVLEAVGGLTRPEAATLLYRLAYEMRTGQAPAAFKAPALPSTSRQPAGCPSESAYRRHLKAGEPVDEACRQHMRALDADWRRRQRRGVGR